MISLGKIKQAVDMKYKYCSITFEIVSLFLLGGKGHEGDNITREPGKN